MRARVMLSCLVLLLPAASFAGSVHSFNVPHRYETCGAAIAGNGNIVGVDYKHKYLPKPFVFAQGEFSFPVVDLPGTILFLGINRANTIVGTATTQGNVESFVLSNGMTKSYAVPGAAATSVAGINDNGDIVGTYEKAGSPYDSGFIQVGSTIKNVDDGTGNTNALGIDPSGKIVVGSTVKGMVYGFVYKDGTFTDLAVPGAEATVATGVDRAGRVSGYYSTGGETVAGFIYEQGQFTTYNVPGSTYTALHGVNAQGVVTGCYTDKKGTHGFFTQP